MPRPHALIPTVTGRLVDLRNPDADEIDISDIAHALASICRFTGQTGEFYSVAEHSVLVSREVPEELALAALLHDAHEAYIGDISRGMKGALWCDELQEANVELEAVNWRIASIVRHRFGVSGDDHPEIDEADNRMAATEFFQLWTPRARERLGGEFTSRFAEPYEHIRFECLSPFFATKAFLYRYDELTGLTISDAKYERWVANKIADEIASPVSFVINREYPRHLAGAAQPGGAPLDRKDGP